MTKPKPALCFRCGYPKSEHTGINREYCHDWPATATWLDPRPALRRLKSRLARLYFVDTHPRREALKRDINHAVSEWHRREANRGAK